MVPACIEMKPAIAKIPDDNTALESIGRATLHIVHDLKNQLNGLKLYATYLRKRLQREAQTVEERETLGKLIAGLDRAAKDMTALVRYAQPIALRKKSPVELARIVSGVASEIGRRETSELPRVPIAVQIDGEELFGEFDGMALSEAIEAITDDIRTTIKSKDLQPLSIRVTRATNEQSVEALIEWQGATRLARQNSFPGSIGCGTIHTALGAKIIEAHGGRVECQGDLIRAWLPLISRELDEQE